MLAMLRRVRAMPDAELRPDGYNIGINGDAPPGDRGQLDFLLPKKKAPHVRGARCWNCTSGAYWALVNPRRSPRHEPASWLAREEGRASPEARYPDGNRESR